MSSITEPDIGPLYNQLIVSGVPRDAVPIIMSYYYLQRVLPNSGGVARDAVFDPVP